MGSQPIKFDEDADNKIQLYKIAFKRKNVQDAVIDMIKLAYKQNKKEIHKRIKSV